MFIGFEGPIFTLRLIFRQNIVLIFVRFFVLDGWSLNEDLFHDTKAENTPLERKREFLQARCPPLHRPLRFVLLLPKKNVIQIPRRKVYRIGDEIEKFRFVHRFVRFTVLKYPLRMNWMEKSKHLFVVFFAGF